MTNLGLTDKPVGSLAEESLGVKDYMEALSNFIETCETPMTIAIQADWGAGKTSMMNLVKERLSQKNKNIETIWFNTWQFSQFDMGDDLPISLLSQFVKRLGGEDSGEVVKKLAGLTKKAGGMLAKVALGSAAGDLLDGGGKVVDALFDNDTLDVSEQIVKLKQDIETIVEKKITKDGNDRVVVFIDDLDRLVPEKAVELLEVMKLFLDIPRCVFVLAVDYNVVIKGLEKKFGSNVDDLKGKSFFDKIIQLPFNLPVAQYDVSKYFKELLHGKFEYKEDDIETFVKLANSSVGFNPRSMKRLFNSLQLLKMVASSKNILVADSVATAEEKQRILFAILCLQTAYESMYRFMLKHKSQINQTFFDLFQDLATLKESEYYTEVKKELGIQDDEDDKLIRFIEFLNTFYEAIQLDSDDSEDADETLSDKELENLMRFLSFSSITTSNTQGIDASSGTFQFKSIALPFMNEILIPAHKTQLKDMQSEFKIHSNNNSGEISFRFRQGSMDFDCVVWRDAKNITFALNHNNGNKKTVKYWAETFIKDIYPNMIYNGRSKYGYLQFDSYKFSDKEMMQGEDAKMEIYKKIAMQGFSQIIPKLNEQYMLVQPIVDSTRNFAQKMIAELEKEFTQEDGWIVKSANITSLNRFEPLNIYHQSWGEDTFSISIEADKSLLRGLYFGIRKKSSSIKLDEAKLEYIYQLLVEKLSGGKSSPWWILWKNFDQYANTVTGEPYYLRTGTYTYETEQNENEAIEYIVSQLLVLREHKDILTELAHAKIS
jgi:hypothetical protein